ncbi:MFS transporter [Clostridium sp. Marseille-P2415]|uniref:MFS transporter n=1 Tax=Clostridium sp. Marseille-P2415 TaxID=1805471 RepID=UPI001F43A3A2|nr:MFS transporter [Clostridium sp. Marseille-P2415]
MFRIFTLEKERFTVRKGSFFIAAFQGFFVKASMGLASAVIGWLLKFGGYTANETQTTKALIYIEASFIWIPLGLCILIAIIMAFYKLDDERKNMDVELEKRRKNLDSVLG